MFFFFSPSLCLFFFFQTQCFAPTETKAGRSPEMRSVRGEGEIRGIMLIPWGRGSATVCMFDENQKWGLGDPFWAQEAKEVYGGEPES